MNRRLLVVDPTTRSWRLETLRVEALENDPREAYFTLSGEALCQYLLRKDPETLVIARGPMPFLSGNKASVGYISPLTGVPHYSFVGGRIAAQLLDLGLDAVRFEAGGQGGREDAAYIVIEGRAPNLTVRFEPSDDLPSGQRTAYYWLVERELEGNAHAGSVLTLGEGAERGYRSANIAADGIYHAGRGGAGLVLRRFATGLVLTGERMEPAEFFVGHDLDPDWERKGSFARNPNAAIASLVDEHCARLSRRTGGTITKLYDTGDESQGHPTLPAQNARTLGYDLADLGGPRVLRQTRVGQTGCHWCQVDCRHYHWVPAEYAPEGRDRFLDDFEPTYAIFAMLGLEPEEPTLEGRIALLDEVDRRLMMPIEQLGCDVINIGVGLAALFEGVELGLIPPDDVPASIAEVPGFEEGTPSASRERLEVAARGVSMLRSGEAEQYPALRAVGDGPQALAERYPEMGDVVFTGGSGTLGNAGHANALWTFMMPFSRFFGHYVGQIYKIDEQLPPRDADPAVVDACFQRVVERMLQRECYWLIGNALSMCAFTFIIFSEGGEGERLSEDDLLVRLLRHYGIRTTRADVEWFAQAFWAQSMDLKAQCGWRPPEAEDFPRRVYEALSLALDRPVDEVRDLMAGLIAEWKRQAGRRLRRFGYEPAW